MSENLKHWPQGKEVLQAGRCEWPKAPSSLAPANRAQTIANQELAQERGEEAERTDSANGRWFQRVVSPPNRDSK